MKVRKILFSLSILMFASGCNVSKELTGAYNMFQCKYEYDSISSLTLSGMDLSKGVSLSYIPQITSVLSGNASSIPLNFTINLDVTNPNQTPALLHGLQYILSIDNVQFTTGSVNQSLNISPGDKAILPLTIGVDLASLMKGESKNAVENITKNFIGIGNSKSNVSLQLKPSFMVGNRTVTYPSYIPVNFSFGGK